MIRIIVVEDNAIVRRGIISLLDEQEDLQVVGAAENGFIAIELLEKGLQSDILLTDFNMPGMDGAILSEKVHVLFPKLKTIILTMHQRNDFVDRARTAGASGYILKDGNFEELFAGIRRVNFGEEFIIVGL